jgi:hypothetical protein
METQPRQGPRLGEVLVQHNVISLENLGRALEEQQQTGRPLGEIIVQRGYAPPHLVAQALATQYGQMVKTEYGYATGFQAQANLQAPPAAAAAAPTPQAAAAPSDPRDATIAELRRQLVTREAEVERLHDMVGQLRAQCVDAAKVKTRLAEAEAELARLRGTVFVG